jgi:hypothetical protein
MTQYDDIGTRRPDQTGWALGGVAFAATMMTMIGIYQVLVGVTAIGYDEFFVRTPSYVLAFDTTTWGWAHLILGAAVTTSGLTLFAGRAWAGGVALVLAALSALSNFLFIPYYPIWSLLMIGLASWVIWAVTHPGVLLE